MAYKIHPTAVVSDSAVLEAQVEVGPYSVIGENVHIGSSTIIGPHVVIGKNTKIGKENKIFQFASVGADPQDLSYRDEFTRLEMGDHNIVREGVTINRGTLKDQGLTKVGNYNLFMANSHIAHDCIIHDHTILVNNALLAGHVEVYNYAIIGAFCAVNQRHFIGAHSFITRGALITNNILPYLFVEGNPPCAAGLNQVGLKRRGFSKSSILAIWKAYKILYYEQSSLETSLEKLKAMALDHPELNLWIEAIEKTHEKKQTLLLISRKQSKGSQ